MDEVNVDVRDGKAGESSPLLSKVDNGDTLSLPHCPKSFDSALEVTGVGFFHCLLVLVAGWALASDSVEVQCISFVTPLLGSKDRNPDTSLAPSKVEEGALDAIIFLGMMFGGYFWGSWSDIVGRRSCLITSLTVNGLFGFASALAPTYTLFLIFRFASGVGVGGSLPVAFSYFCEFFSKKNRGPFVIILAGFWTLGSVFAAVTALLIIEHVDFDPIVLGSIHLTPWRVYIMVCTFPCLSAAILLVFLPESPSFLFDKGKTKKALKTLTRIARINRLCSPKGKSPKDIDFSFLIEEKEKEKERENDPLRVPKTKLKKFADKACLIFQATRELFTPAYLRASVVLLVVWFTFSFGYYGLLLWFPEYFKCVYEKQWNCAYDLDHPDTCAPHGVKVECNDTGSIYVDSLYTSLATIPGTILGIITVNILGGKMMLALSVFVCGISAFLIRVVPPREGVIVILSSVFNGVAVFGWNALDVISTSSIFPVHLRSTAFGIQAVFGRVGAILGNLSFGRLITVDPFIPILLVAALLILGGLVGFLLPNPRGESSRKNLSKCARLCCSRPCLSLSCCRKARPRNSVQSTD